MTRERIEDMREVVMPFVKKSLLEINYEGLGESDAKEFEREFNEILNLAIKTLEQESITKNNLGVDAISRADALKLMQDNWHTHNGDWAMQESMDDIRALPSVTPQEPKPMVEIDLYSVIKQKYIEREVLDKIRAEIAEYGSIWVQYQITGKSDRDIEQLVRGVLKQAKEQVLDIIDKYKSEGSKEA